MFFTLLREKLRCEARQSEEEEVSAKLRIHVESIYVQLNFLVVNFAGIAKSRLGNIL